MSKKHSNPVRELDKPNRFPALRRASEPERVITEFSYVGEGGGWVVVEPGPIPSGLPPAQLRYAQHMGWISVSAAEEPVTLPDDKPKEADDVTTILG